MDVIPSFDPLAVKTITLTGNNTTNLALSYTMKLIIENNTFSDNAISYLLEAENTSDNGGIILKDETNQGILNGPRTIILASGQFNKGSNLVHTYTLNIYFLETGTAQNIDQGKNIDAHVEVESGIAEELVNWFNPLDGSLLKAIKDSNPVTEPLTIPGRAISTSGEAVLASAPDDYGVSYYFRGNVQNNYVVFANMCWRIVRVVGDASIKLVLYNYNPNSVANPCDTSENGNNRAFARHYSSTYTTTFGNVHNSNAGIGLMYGAPGSGTYAAEHANTTKSNILRNLEDWYNRDNQFAIYEHLLADTIWCNDKSMDTVYPREDQLGYGTSQTNYSAKGRIYAEMNEANPSLICPDDSNGGKLSKFTVSDTANGNGALTKKIGLLTVDEVAFAGARWNYNTSSYYLYRNASSDGWLTLSPHSQSASIPYIWYVLSNGRLDSSTNYSSQALCPAVSLLSTTKISDGDGTNINPYLVQITE